MAYNMTAGGTVNRFEPTYATVPTLVSVVVHFVPIGASWTRTGYFWHHGTSSTISFRCARLSVGTLSVEGSFVGGQSDWRFPDPPVGAVEDNTTLVVTWDRSDGANQPVVYYDGVSQTLQSSTPSSGAPTESGLWGLGDSRFDTTGGFTFEGGISEFAIYDRILSAAEISYLGARAMMPKFVRRGLVFYAPLMNGVFDHQQTGAITTIGAPGQFRSRPITRFPRRRAV